MNSEIERIREALRGKRLSVLATELGVPMPTLEQFVSGSARLAPELLAALAKVLESSNPNPSAHSKNIPAPVPRKPDMKLSARSLKVTAVPDPAFRLEPDWVKPGAAVLDLSHQGNIDSARLDGRASLVTSPENRLGKITRAMMFVNLVYCARYIGVFY